MPDLPDLSTPLPDPAHEALRANVVQALADLAAHVESLADAFLLAQTAGDGLDIALTNFVALQNALTAQAQQIADLQSRVSALENPPPAA